MSLAWLPEPANWPEATARAAAGDLTFDGFVTLANTRLTPSRTNQLDRLLGKAFPAAPPAGLGTRPVRLAILSSSTISHLLPAIRVGALRRRIWVETYAAPFGAALQDLVDPASGLQAFGPDTVLFAFDAPHLTGLGPDAAIAHLRELWRMARERFGCAVIQQTLLPVALPLLGSNEHRLRGSRHDAISEINHAIRAAADADGVDLLALDDQAARHGRDAWHDPVWWLRAKQEVSPGAAPAYGDLVGRLLAAGQGLSKKCLVLDLDNTLWGGVVGDDGLAGLVLGQGSAEGEAHLGLQAYARDLAARGIILAVVSKNDEANALEVFDHHPEMLLRRADIAAFFANWDDKAQNLRRVAATLGIGLEALVFVDDNPFERELVRSELPMVAVPELPEDPSGYADRIAQAGYFEALGITEEDRARTRHYAANAERATAVAQAADLPTYLAGLDMRLIWRPFDALGLPRIVQLVNKTNQFNLTTRRTTEVEIRALMDDPDAIGLQFRLVDRLGDNGMIGVVIARRTRPTGFTIDTWLMSCRVLGRRVEAAMLSVLVESVAERGGDHLVGLYRPSPKNAMVARLYPDLGFAALASEPDEARFGLDLSAYVPEPSPIRSARG
ncbi:HAD-IIIC family phosphatase [Methylobacterium sp. BTF04]|uniref:HAD-IIIC family phosphatase n=1 Tax=Methylobacterium sp. BTF04 TaxID=2708300 RepID=UPI0013D78BD6|nr:HAD-IIIC family phosphatase [Methylobacterium sp. BTF04]NEU13239.1 HAD-IIIC family phosphatase [Methylobacterium sp. BTF04]